MRLERLEVPLNQSVGSTIQGIHQLDGGVEGKLCEDMTAEHSGGACNEHDISCSCARMEIDRAARDIRGVFLVEEFEGIDFALVGLIDIGGQLRTRRKSGGDRRMGITRRHQEETVKW